MITTTDIGNILYAACAKFGIPVVREGNIGYGNTDSERIVIHPRPLSSGTHWDKGFQEVNFIVPDTIHGDADLKRLGDLERLARLSLHAVSRYDGTRYEYRVDQTSIVELRDLKAHYVNVKVLFRALHTLENNPIQFP